MGGRDHAHVDLDRRHPAYGMDLGFLQDAQQSGLGSGWQVADLVEQQRAAIGRPNQAQVVGVGAGERALAVAEELRFDKAHGQGAAVDPLERAGAPRELVDGTRDHFLARSGLAAQQHRQPGPGDELQAIKLLRERGQQRCERRQAGVRSGVEDVGARPREARTEEKEGVPQLEERAVSDLGALDAAAIAEDAVLRAGVFENPGREHPLQPRMHRRDPGIGDADVHAVHPPDPAALDRERGRAAQGHRVDARERNTGSSVDGPIAAKHEEEPRLAHARAARRLLLPGAG